MCRKRMERIDDPNRKGGNGQQAAEKKAPKKGKNGNGLSVTPLIIYIIPTFDNPTDT